MLWQERRWMSRCAHVEGGGEGEVQMVEDLSEMSTHLEV